MSERPGGREEGGGQDARATGRQRFLILARKANDATGR